jgi:hypothetical protein
MAKSACDRDRGVSLEQFVREFPGAANVPGMNDH